MLQGSSSLSCIDNLYKSLSDLSPDIYLMSEGLKDELTKPLVATQYELVNKILPIGTATLSVKYCHSYYDPKSG
ncbi:tyrosine/dopa decarboxylase, partial [Trifolium medium]|nr:tyrosine/dopa decarboxylase [Trifolium medium]